MLSWKLTNADGRTLNDTMWGENITHRASGKGGKPCTPGVIHYYADPLLAVLMHPVHGQFQDPILWEGEAEEELGTDGLKWWCKEYKTIRQIPLPEISTAQRVRFAILCSLNFPQTPAYATWAENWLTGRDRTVSAANAAYDAARAACVAAFAAARAGGENN